MSEDGAKGCAGLAMLGGICALGGIDILWGWKVYLPAALVGILAYMQGWFTAKVPS